METAMADGMNRRGFIGWLAALPAWLGLPTTKAKAAVVTPPPAVQPPPVHAACGPASTAGLQYITTHTYDANGILLSVSRHGPVYTSTYDVRGGGPPRTS